MRTGPLESLSPRCTCQRRQDRRQDPGSFARGPSLCSFLVQGGGGQGMCVREARGSRPRAPRRPGHPRDSGPFSRLGHRKKKKRPLVRSRPSYRRPESAGPVDRKVKAREGRPTGWGPGRDNRTRACYVAIRPLATALLMRAL